MIKGSNGTTKTKVSQATIDKIKKMGMTAALKSAPKANAEMTEALRRMYGQKRLDAATKVSKPARAVMTRPGSAPKSNAPSAISGNKVSTSSTTKATPAKSSSMGLPGVTRGATSKPKSTTTSASTTDRRKAAAAAVKRAGGRSM